MIDPATTTVAVLCGGPATRLYPLTHEIPKALIPVGGIPIVEDLVRTLAAQGFKRFVFCERHLADQILKHFGNGSAWGVSITHVVEQEPLGTAGALAFAAPHLSDTFLAIQGDLVLRADLRKMLSFHERKHGAATLLVHKSSHPEDSDLVEADSAWRVKRLFRPTPAERFLNMGNAGVFLFSKELLCSIPPGKRFIEKDWLPSLLGTHTILAYYTEEYVKDMGTLARLDHVNAIMDLIARERPAIFLDRDGVVVHDDNLMTAPEQLRLIDGSAEAIKAFNDAGIPVVIVTNQPAVARNRCTEDDVRNMHDTLQYLLVQHDAHVDGFFYCPHHPETTHPEANDPRYRRDCDCRKPKPGMLLRAAREMRLSLSSSVMVGDTTGDIAAGQAAGCASTLLVKTGYGGSDGKYPVVPTMTVSSLAAAVPFILEKVGR